MSIKLDPIKSVHIYRAELPHDPKELTLCLKELEFTEMQENDLHRTGFVPNPATGDLVSVFQGGYSFCVRHDEKIIPSAAVAFELKKRVAAAEDQRGEPLTRDEISDLKSLIPQELAKTALGRSSVTHAYYDTKSGYLFISTSADQPAKRVMGCLVKVMGSVTTQTVNVGSVKGNLTARLKSWYADQARGIQNESAGFGKFWLGENCRVVKKVEGHKEVLTYRGVDLADREELHDLLSQGYQVESVSLGTPDIEFQLDQSFRVKSIHWTAYLRQQKTADYADQVEEWQQTFAIKTLLLSKVAHDLCSLFEYSSLWPKTRALPRQDTEEALV